MPQNQTNKMSLKKSLSFWLLAIAAGLSLQYFSAGNAIHALTRPPSKSPLFYTHSHLMYNASATKEIVSKVEEFHAEYFVDDHFTTEELAMYSEAKAVIEFLHEPLQAILALDSNTKLLECRAITRSLETCAVWSISANTDPTTARPYLCAINNRVHRCIEALDNVMEQHNLLEQLAERLIDGDNGFVMEAPPLQDFALTHGAPVRGFSSRAFSFRLSAIVLSYRLEDWKHNNSADVESLASIREFLVGKSESLAAAVAGYDVRFAKGLPLLLENCHDECQRLLR
jgi:hypothetical protein